MLAAHASPLCPDGDRDACRVACDDNKEALSCARHGRIELVALRKGEDAAPRKSFERSCELGYAEACFSLGLLWSNGVGGAKDVAAALRLYEHACQGGSPSGCYSVAVRFDVDGVGQDLAKARGYYQKACDGAYGKACNNLAPMLELGEGGPKKPLAEWIRYMPRGRTAPMAVVTTALKCGEGTQGFRSTYNSEILWFCGRVEDGKTLRHGVWVRWNSLEDEAAGLSDGVVRERGDYREDERIGTWEYFDSRGEATGSRAY